MYNMHKEGRSGNKKNEQFYERRELFSKNKLIKKVKKKIQWGKDYRKNRIWMENNNRGEGEVK